MTSIPWVGLGELMCAAVSCSTAAWAWRRRCRALPDLRRIRPVTAGCGRVSVIVPARNESARIRRCLQSLLRQDYSDLEIIVVDDCSTDDTSVVLHSMADPRLIVVRATPPAPGTMGKASAIVQGYRHASGEWLVFTDADTEHDPSLVGKTVGALVDRERTFGTVLAEQRFPTVGSSMVSVAVFAWVLLLWDCAGFADPSSPSSMLNGQFVVFHRRAYDAIGTHQAVVPFSSTDASLGYLAKLQGWRPLLLGGPGLRTTMYESAVEAFRGWSRSAVNLMWTRNGAVRGTMALGAFVPLMLIVWLAPWVLIGGGVWRGSASMILVGILQLGAAVVLQRLQGRRGRALLTASVLMPPSSLVFAAIVMFGLVSAWVHGGTVWKGRVVHTSQRLPPWRPAGARPSHAADASDRTQWASSDPADAE